MAEYFEREALIAKFKQMELGEHGLVERLFADGVYAVIAAFPAADVAQVVRCGSCKHIRPEVDASTGETVGYWCAELDIGSIDVDDFCSHGKRKENNHEKN